ncbi:MAG: DNA adenine methylase [Candidatus Obscuribacterales bacterium]|nr:DNA adenine methylase [Candidatus Obscuribacterales bacterium]
MFVESPFKQKTQSAPELVGHTVAKPFLKWVGGKTQLIEQLDSNVPLELRDGSVEKYVEPFVGGGSFFLHVAQKYAVKKLIIADSNQDLILAYWTIKSQVDLLIQHLQKIQIGYLSLNDNDRQEYYYQTRKEFNDQKFSIDVQTYSDDWIERTSQLLFLNKTCFNGLFRVNAAGMFNVAFGRYDNPKICDPGNLQAVSQILQRTQILLGDFTCVREHLDSKTFVYLDPPYRPLTETANFTAYSSSTFTNADQKRLADFAREATVLGCKLMISNSDPDNIDSSDTYFLDNYPDYRIERAFANRMVNCKADRRGKISELIIMNYQSCSEKVSSSEETEIDPEAAQEPAADAAAEAELEAPAESAQELESPTQAGSEAVPAAVPTAAPQATAEAKTSAVRRNSSALGAFQLLYDCAKSERPFSLEDLEQTTGWKSQTARTYVSKKWKHYLDPVDGARPAQFTVRLSFLQLNEESFLNEFSQVLANTKAVPQTVEEAKEQALTALSTYANMIGAANNTSAEKRIRRLIEQIGSI